VSLEASGVEVSMETNDVTAQFVAEVEKVVLSLARAWRAEPLELAAALNAVAKRLEREAAAGNVHKADLEAARKQAHRAHVGEG